MVLTMLVRSARGGRMGPPPALAKVANVAATQGAASAAAAVFHGQEGRRRHKGRVRLLGGQVHPVRRREKLPRRDEPWVLWLGRLVVTVPALACGMIPGRGLGRRLHALLLLVLLLLMLLLMPKLLLLLLLLMLLLLLLMLLLLLLLMLLLLPLLLLGPPTPLLGRRGEHAPAARVGSRRHRNNDAAFARGATDRDLRLQIFHLLGEPLQEPLLRLKRGAINHNRVSAGPRARRGAG
jgi:hypothetical protein